MSVRVRFPPSPTGYLHIGSVRTALFNWLFARKHGGVLILRIEDTDLVRSKREYERQIVQGLRWLGLDWDEGLEVGGPHGPYRQTERGPQYEAAIQQLLASGGAYRCTCSRERLDRLREAQSAAKEKPRYDRRCRDLDLGPDCGPHVVRIKTPLEGTTVVDDKVKGRVEFDNAELDDWIIRRTDGSPTYNFVVVVDDRDMGVTHVIRGDDHLNNTPKQQTVYERLGAPLPVFAHLPLILAPDGSRLSKRFGAISVDEYREMGILPEAMINYLTRLGWAHGEMEAFSKEEAIAAFSLEGINSSGAKWDMTKLLWLNQHWMKRLPLEVIAERAAPFFEKAGLPVADNLAAAVDTLRERSQTLVELAEKARFYYADDEALAYDEAAVQKFLKAGIQPALAGLADALEGAGEWSVAGLEAAAGAWLESQGLKLGKIAQPVRVAITGQSVGPGLFETLAALGRERSLRRIRRGAAMAGERAG